MELQPIFNLAILFSTLSLLPMVYVLHKRQKRLQLSPELFDIEFDKESDKYTYTPIFKPIGQPVHYECLTISNDGQTISYVADFSTKGGKAQLNILSEKPIDLSENKGLITYLHAGVLNK